jgi:hypothetical protein
LLYLEKHVSIFGNVKYWPRSGWRKKCLTIYEAVSTPVDCYPKSIHRHNQQSLVCHGQWSKVTWRKACIRNCITQNLWVNCHWHWHEFMRWYMWSYELRRIRSSWWS